MRTFGSGFAVVAGAALAMIVGLGIVAADTPAMPSNLPPALLARRFADAGLSVRIESGGNLIGASMAVSESSA